MAKPYQEQSAEERIASLDKIQNVLVHADWMELYLRWAADAAELRQEMEGAQNWEHFVATRAMYTYVNERLLKLRELVKAEKEELEELRDHGDKPLPPIEYETE